MPRGTFTVEAPHICGELIPVRVDWSDWPGTRWEPPDHDEQWTYYDDNKQHRCLKCGVDLDNDTIFYDTVQALADRQYASSEMQPGDDMPEMDPDDFDKDEPAF